MRIPAFLRRVRESNAATAAPQLDRAGARDDDDDATESQATERDVSDEDRKKLAKSGAALPDGSFPIETKADLANAVKAYGRAKDKPAAKAHIIKRAKALGATDTLPDDWTSSKEAAAMQKCDECGGTGQVAEADCPECDGTGKVPADDKARETARHIREHGVQATEASKTTAPDGTVVYEVTIIREGLGNPDDANLYTREALQAGVDEGIFEGLKAFADHPTLTEERELPERSIHKLVGHYREAKLVEENGSAKVRAQFVPITGPEGEKIVALIDSALKMREAGVGREPLIGISIDGWVDGDSETLANGTIVNRVNHFDLLLSADLVTSPGAGGQFERRLQESLRSHHNHRPSKENPMKLKANEVIERVKNATAKLRESTAEGKSEEEQRTAVGEAFATLDEIAQAEVEPEVREVEKVREVKVPVAADENDEADKLKADLEAKDTELEETKTQLRESNAEVKTFKKTLLIGKVIRESKLPADEHEFVLPDLQRAESEDEMRGIVDRYQREHKRIEERIQESLGHVEGAGPRPARVAESTDARKEWEDAGIPTKEEEPEAAAA